MAKNARGILTIQRPGLSERNMWHEGNVVFMPAGAEAVRVRFEVAVGKARGLTAEDGLVVVRAKRLAI